MILLTLLPLVFLDYLLRSVGFVPGVIRSAGMTLALGCFLLGGGAVVFNGASKRKALIWLSGLAVGVGAIGLSALLVAVQFLSTNPMALLILTGVGLVSLLAVQEVRSRSTTSAQTTVTPSQPDLVFSMKRVFSPTVILRAVEVIGMPESYIGISEDQKAARRGYVPFHEILRTLTLSEVPCAIRLERFSGRTRVFYLTWSKDVKGADRCQSTLLDTLRANLPEFDVKALGEFRPPIIDPQTTGVAATLMGEPLSVEDEHQRDDPLTAVVAILRHSGDAVLQVSSAPYRPNKSELRSRESQYEQALQRSQQTVSSVKRGFFAGNSQSSTTLVNATAARDAEQLAKQVQRYSSRYLCNVTVSAACWDRDPKYAEKSACRILESLMGAIVPASRENDFRVKVRKGTADVNTVLRGQAIGEKVTLTPQEATVYFVLPRSDVGIRVNRRDAFAMGSTAGSVTIPIVDPNARPRPVNKPASSMTIDLDKMMPVMGQGSIVEWRLPDVGGIFLGYAFGKDGEPLNDRPVYVRIEDLDSHFGIFGSTRTGKSTVAMSMVAQMTRFGISPIVILPFKGDEWMWILHMDPKARFFIAGKKSRVRITYNFFNPPSGVRLSRWIEVLRDILTASLPTDRVIAMHLDDVIHTAYRRCGWNISEETHGRPVLLSDLYESVKEVYGHLGYGSEIRSNVYGALLARIRAMLRNPAVLQTFNTDQGITIPELLENTTLITMDGMGEDDKVLLTAILTAAIAEYRLANPLKKVRNVLVIEEAHFLLTRQPETVDGMPTAQGKAIKNIVTMLRTAGGVGLGVMLLDQLPGSLDSDALRLIVNSIVFRLNDPDYEIAGRHARCTESQREHITGMKRGEAIVFLECEGVPLNVQITPLKELVVIPGTKKERDKRLLDQITGVLKEHPAWGASLPLPEEIVRALEGAESMEGTPAVQPPAVMQTPASESRIRVLTQEQEDALRSEIAKDTFLDYINARLPAAKNGDYDPLIRFLREFGGVFCPPETDKGYFVRRATAIAQEIHGVPELEEAARRLNPVHAEAGDVVEESEP